MWITTTCSLESTQKNSPFLRQFISIIEWIQIETLVFKLDPSLKAFPMISRRNRSSPDSPKPQKASFQSILSVPSLRNPRTSPSKASTVRATYVTLLISYLASRGTAISPFGTSDGINGENRRIDSPWLCHFDKGCITRNSNTKRQLGLSLLCAFELIGRQYLLMDVWIPLLRDLVIQFEFTSIRLFVLPFRTSVNPYTIPRL